MIFTVHSSDTAKEVLEAQKKVFDHFDIPLDQAYFEYWHGHGGSVDRYIETKDWEWLALFDSDCIPLNRTILAEAVDFAKRGGIFAAAQKASHFPNSIIYASPAFFVIARGTYEKLGNPSFAETKTQDTAAAITYKAREQGIKVHLLYPTHVEKPMWNLDGHIMFGKGTTYGNEIYHSFLARKGENERFIKKCEETLKNF